ncbi:serine kinase [Erythrobacter aquimaris]|uniref:Serine kinase n=1 Tax=Qipengyuania aquimaris TaxID=255984 RepID=A0A6I4TGT5_9SPHN|nr:HPr kinase/phosphatase C-terminal domain-containing protein [Qipengyuania aquimaris]MXO95075.1 serine kinase [Qipengyuania aquimaris]
MSEALFNVSCVCLGGRAILISGAPGSGKTSLALALIDRGAELIGDDGISLRLSDGIVIAGPPPETTGQIEVRNVGIVELPTTTAPIALVLDLNDKAARFPLEDKHRKILGIPIPLVEFRPGDAIQALRAQYALDKHGLRVPYRSDGGAKKAR